MKKEKWYRPLISAYRNLRSRDLTRQIKEVLPKIKGDLPVLVICYNNGVYVENIVKQFNKFKIFPIIINNKSSDQETLSTLSKLEQTKLAYVVHSTKNFGHFVGLMDSIYKELPRNFAYTDPDLKLNPLLPENFIEQLISITEKYCVFKAGFALDLLEKEEIIDVSQVISQTKPFSFCKEFNVREYEKRFWRLKLTEDSHEIYFAPIDSTFAVYNKDNYIGDMYDAVRVAGNFSAIHLPWFPKLDIMNAVQKEAYLVSDRKKDTTWIKK